MSDIIILLTTLLVGYICGSRIEKKHFKDLIRREIKLIKAPFTTKSKNVIYNSKKIKKIELVSGCAVIGSDYFKDFISGFRNFFGGRMISYESVLDRARREAILRMRESALYANVIVNLKLETTTLNESTSNQPAQVAVIAYGTAITYEKEAA